MENFIKSTIESICKLGIRFFAECNFELCYKALKKPIIDKKAVQYEDYYHEMLQPIKQYAEDNGINLLNLKEIKTHNWLKYIRR